MKLNVAIQMDHVSSIDIDGDSTFVLGLEAERRGYAVWHYTPPDLIFRDRKVLARAQPMKLRREKGNHFTLGAPEMLDLATLDVVLLRQDPPFDMSYITTTHILEHIHPKTLVVNDPASVRNAPEKLFVTHFDNVMPPTLICSDARAIRAFRDEHKDIILKPLFGNGGAGVFRVRPDDENFNSLLEMFSQRSREPVIAQRYLPEVRKGDKRIILIDGKAVGVINRVPAEGEARSNMHVGGVAVKDVLTKRDQELCDIIGPELAKRGLLFVGIDVIGDYLTEINVTSPTGLQQINRFDGVALEAQIWDAIEARYQATRRARMIRRTFLALTVIPPAILVGMGPALAQIDTLTLKPIVKAVREGDEEKVRSALLKGESPNQIDTNGQPLLMVAVVAGQIAVVETLLKGGAIRRQRGQGGQHLADPGRRDAATSTSSRSCSPKNAKARRADAPGRHGAHPLPPAAAMPRSCARCSPRRPIPTRPTSPAARRWPMPARPASPPSRPCCARPADANDVGRGRVSARPRRSGYRVRSRSIRPRSKKASCAPPVRAASTSTRPRRRCSCASTCAIRRRCRTTCASGWSGWPAGG